MKFKGIILRGKETYVDVAYEVMINIDVAHHQYPLQPPKKLMPSNTVWTLQCPIRVYILIIKNSMLKIMEDVWTLESINLAF